MIISILYLSWFTLVLLLILFALLYFQLTQYHGYWESRGVPCEKPLLFFGNLWEVFSGQRPIGKHLGQLYNKFDAPYFGIYIVGKPYLVLRNPEIIKNITVRDFHNFEDRTFANDKKADPMAANSLFILRNPDWKGVRANLTPIFTSGKLKLMFPIMKRCGNKMDQYLSKHSHEVLDIKDIAANYMTDLVASCFFGLTTDSFGEKGCEFRTVTKKMFTTDVYTSLRLFSYFFVPKLVSLLKLKFFDTTFLENVFLSALVERKSTGKRRNDFVDLLLTVKEKFDGPNCAFGVYITLDT